MDVVVAEVVDKEVNKVIMDVVVVDKVVEEVNRWWRRSTGGEGGEQEAGQGVQCRFSETLPI